MSVVQYDRLSKESDSSDRLEAMLRALSGDYVPPLDTIVDIREYSEKLLKNAEVLLARVGDLDVGVLGIYVNDTISKVGFISTIGVIPTYRGRGLALALLTRADSIATEAHMESIKLEVGSSNVAALTLYQRHGFLPQGKSASENTDSLVLRKELHA